MFKKKSKEPAAPAELAPDQFTELSRRAASDPSATGELWKAVYDLDEWHFLPGGDAEAALRENRMIPPLITSLEGKPFVAAFTSAERAHHAAVHSGLKGSGGSYTILSLKRPNAAAMLCGMPDDVFGVLFNHNAGEQGFFAPMDNVAAMSEYHLGEVPEHGFHRFARAVIQANQPPVWGRLMRQLVAMDTWFFVGDAERPKAPRLVSFQDEPMPLIFTGHREAMAGGAGEDLSPAQVPLISSPPAEALGFCRKLTEDSEGQITSALFNLGAVPFVLRFEDLERAMQG